MKSIEKINFKKKSLNSKDLLLDDDITQEHNDFNDLDENEMFQYLCDRYGFETIALMYGYGSVKKMKKANKKIFKEKGKKKKNKIINADFSENDMFQDSCMNNKTIYYYRDVDDPNDCCQFESLHEFDEFLNEEGIEISDDEVNKIMEREISYCTINPYERFVKNRLRLISSCSYGDLRFASAELEYECEYQ